jgi:hypothetical protein
LASDFLCCKWSGRTTKITTRILNNT